VVQQPQRTFLFFIFARMMIYSLLCLHTARNSSTCPSASTLSDTDTHQTIHVAFHFGDFSRQTYINFQKSVP